MACQHEKSKQKSERAEKTIRAGRNPCTIAIERSDRNP